jgi:hypothetical protein
MANDSGELGFRPRHLKNAAVDTDLAAWQRKRVGFGIVEQDKLPLSILDGDDRFEPTCDPGYRGKLSAVLRQSLLGFHLLKLGQSHFVEMTVGNEIEGSPTCVWDRSAGEQSNGDDQTKGQVQAE